MRNSENIKALVSLKPDYIGFIFYKKSKRYAEKVLDKAILNLIPTEINKVGVFVNEPIAEIHRICQKFSLNHVQLHGDESTEDCLKVKNLGYTLIKAFGINEEFDFTSLDKYEKYVDFFLFDTKTKDYGGSGKAYNWKFLKKYKGEKPYFLSGGISKENVKEALMFDDKRMQVLDINSNFESKPGLKNIKLLQEEVFTRI